jgi:hypothetical protein
MHTSDFRNPGSIAPMKFPMADMPHATIETNRTCNMRCAYCYNLEHESVKPLSVIQSEIDLLLKTRNPQTITILGGEPTLHPDLLKVVEYIKSKNVLCQLLTNGLLFLAADGEQLVDRLVVAGIDRITLHVDHGQSHVHNDIGKTRQALSTMMERKRVHFSFSITIDEDELGTIPDLEKRFAGLKYFDGVLAILAKDPLDPQRPTPRLEDVYNDIADRLNIEPSAYVPSNRSDSDVRWLIYYYFVNANTGKTFAIGSGVFRKIGAIYRFFVRRRLFILKLPPALAGAAFVLTTLLDFGAGLRRPRMFLECLRGSGLLRAIRLHYVAVQVPPEFNESTRTLTMCHHCPDATVRNGMLVPVCIADQMSPMVGAGIIESQKSERYKAVREHLSEETAAASH